MQETSSVQYGSQTDELEWYTDKVALPGVGHASVEFGVVTSAKSRTGGPPANVLGLATSVTRKEKYSFLDQLMFQDQVFPPCFYFDFLNGPQQAKFGIGNCPQLEHVETANTLPLLNQHDLKDKLGIDIGVDFYFASLEAVYVNGAKIRNNPPYCMLDTGNTNLTLNSGFYSNFRTALDTNSEIVFEFVGGLRLTYETSFDPQADIDHTPFLDAAPFSGQVLILGNTWMNKRLWAYNVENHTVTIGA